VQIDDPLDGVEHGRVHEADVADGVRIENALDLDAVALERHAHRALGAPALEHGRDFAACVYAAQRVAKLVAPQARSGHRHGARHHPDMKLRAQHAKAAGDAEQQDVEAEPDPGPRVDAHQHAAPAQRLRRVRPASPAGHTRAFGERVFPHCIGSVAHTDGARHTRGSTRSAATARIGHRRASPPVAASAASSSQSEVA
jgi:hypothetical protein